MFVIFFFIKTNKQTKKDLGKNFQASTSKNLTKHQNFFWKVFLVWIKKTSASPHICFGYSMAETYWTYAIFQLKPLLIFYSPSQKFNFLLFMRASHLNFYCWYFCFLHSILSFLIFSHHFQRLTACKLGHWNSLICISLQIFNTFYWHVIFTLYFL